MLTARILYQSDLVSVRDVLCCGEHGRGRHEETTTGSSVALVRRGHFVRRDSFGRHIADSTRILFFNHGAPYTVDHPEPHGDRCTALTFREDIVREAGAVPGRRGDAEAAFDRGSARSTPALHVAHRRLLQSIAAGDTWHTQELALALLADVNAVDRARTRISTGARRAATRLAEQTQRILASEFCEPLTLELVAKRLDVSPFHLCRQFGAELGRSLHSYLTELRLNEALERLPNYRNRLSRLAVDLGFSSHSHFSQAFRAHFGQPPSRLA